MIKAAKRADCVMGEWLWRVGMLKGKLKKYQAPCLSTRLRIAPGESPWREQWAKDGVE
jgi:hypothetical protein